MLLTRTPLAAFCACRRYWRGNFRLVRKLGEKRGGRYLGGVHFEYLGGQFASGLSMISYLRSGQYRYRYFGVPIPATNVQQYQLTGQHVSHLDGDGTLSSTGWCSWTPRRPAAVPAARHPLPRRA